MLTGIFVLSGCTYTTYITEQGTQVTPELIAQAQQRQSAEFMPYSATDVSFRAFAAWSDEFIAKRDAWRQKKGIPLQHESAIAVVSGWATEDAPAVATVHFQDIARPDPKSLVYLPGVIITAMTGYLIPGYIKQHTFNEMQIELADGSVVKHETKVVRKQVMSLLPLGLGDHEGMADLLTANDYAAVISHEEWLRKEIQAEQSKLAEVNKEDIASLTEAMRDPEIVLLRPQLKADLATLLAQRKDRLDHYRALTSEFSDFVDYIPGHEKLFFIGPQNLRVIDVWQQIKQRADSAVLAATIRSAQQPYRIFDSEETAWLRKQGIPYPVITAMIEASAPATASGSGAAASDQASAESSGTAAECAKALAARKACERIPGDPFGIAVKVCVGQVKKKFGGMNCPLL
jgi:hypothetical protein